MKSEDAVTGRPTPASQSMSLAEFRRDDFLWPRQGLDRSRVREFVLLYRHGGPEALPSILLMEVDGRLYLADGWHRCSAALEAGITHLPALVKRGERIEDVYLEAVAASATTDKPLTRAEKRAAVDRLLAMKLGYSDRCIARLAGVSQPFVSKRRKRVGQAREEARAPRKELSLAQREARKLVRALIALDRLHADLRHCTHGATPARGRDRRRRTGLRRRRR